MQRHLDLIDRLLADKEKLSKQLEDSQGSLAAQDSKHAAAVEALKAGWAKELRLQKEQWVAAEKVHLSRLEAA